MSFFESWLLLLVILSDNVHKSNLKGERGTKIFFSLAVPQLV